LTRTALEGENSVSRSSLLRHNMQSGMARTVVFSL